MQPFLSVLSFFREIGESHFVWIKGEKEASHLPLIESPGKACILSSNICPPDADIRILHPRALREITLSSKDEWQRLFAACRVLILSEYLPHEELPSFIYALPCPIVASPDPHGIVQQKCEMLLRYYVSPSITLSGVFLDILGMGVLLSGESGIGKSEIGLSLIREGHKLIADDAVHFALWSEHCVMGRSPALLQDFLEVRGLGVLNIRKMFGNHTLQPSRQLQLITELKHLNPEALRALDRLSGAYREENILGVPIPVVTLPLTLGRNMAVLVEAAVRNYILRQTGYHAASEFIQKQQRWMAPV